jgi:hypothetical protein
MDVRENFKFGHLSMHVIEEMKIILGPQASNSFYNVSLQKGFIDNPSGQACMRGQPRSALLISDIHVSVDATPTRYLTYRDRIRRYAWAILSSSMVTLSDIARLSLHMAFRVTASTVVLGTLLPRQYLTS